MRVGYLGLGSLGAPIAACIARGGFPLTVFDVVPAAVAGFAAPGAVKAGAALEVAQASEVLCVCVRTDTDLDALADDALLAALGENGVLMIHSTVAPELCVTLDQRAAPHGVSVLDCGVSRGGAAVVNGDLSIYLGGPDKAVEMARPLLDCLGTWRHLGPVGRGMQGKLLNNLVSIANYACALHILDLGAHLGFDRTALREMLMAGSAQSFAMKVAPGFVTPERRDNMRTLLGKDVEHAKHLADPDLPAMRALIPAAQSLIERLGDGSG